MQISKPNPDRNGGSNWGGQTASAYEVVVSTLHDPVLILKKDLVVESANAAFGQTFRIKIEEAVGCRLYELRNGQWNIPALLAAINGVISDGAPVRDYRLDQEFEEIGRRVLVLNVHSVCHESGELLTTGYSGQMLPETLAHVPRLPKPYGKTTFQQLATLHFARP